MIAPLAIILHGLGHDPSTGVASFAPAIPADMTLHALAGPLLFGDGPGRAWFGVAFTDQGPVADVGQARASRDAVIEAAERSANPVTLFGFGQGGVMALAAFLARPDLFTGCAVVGGRILLDMLPETLPSSSHQGKPIFWAHGRTDPAIPFAMAETGRELLGGYKVALTTFDHDGGHELPSAAVDPLREWLTQATA